MTVCFCVIMMPAAVSAQTVTVDLPTFADRIEVHLVTLRVVVTTVLDQPVIDLTRDDFEIWEDGERREITHFERVTDGAIEGAGRGDLREAGGEEPVSADLERLVVLAFDSSSVADLPYQRRAIVAARDFVTDHADPGVSWSVVLVGSDPRCVVPPSADIAPVVEGLDSLRDLFGGDPARRVELQGSFRASDEMPRLAGSWCRLSMTEQAIFMPQTTRALTNLFRAYGALPGAKACVFYHPGPEGENFAGCGGLSSLDMMRHQEIVDLWQAVARQASTAGFKVYGMTTKGLRPPMANASSRNSVARARRSIFDFSSADAAGIMAARTGGDTFTSNDLGMVIDRAMKETGNYYSLAFAAPRGHDGDEHDIDVKVRGRGIVKVRHNKGTFDVDPRTLLVEQLATPPEFPKVGGDVPVALVVRTERVESDRMEVSIAASAVIAGLAPGPDDGGPAADLDVFLAVHDGEGRLLGITQERHPVAFSEGAETADTVVVPLRLLLPAESHTVSVGIFDPVSRVAGMGTSTVGPNP